MSYDLAATFDDQSSDRPNPMTPDLKTWTSVRRQLPVRKHLATLGVEPSSWPTRQSLWPNGLMVSHLGSLATRSLNLGVPTQFSWPLESTPLSPGSSLYRPPQSLSLFPRGRAPSRNRLPQPPAPPSLAHLRKPATVSPQTSDRLSAIQLQQATTTTTLRPTKRPVCFVSLCFLTSTRHNYSSTSHSSFDHASSASFISFMVLSSSLLVFCVEDTFISTFCRVSTGLGMFVSILINSPVVDTTKQAIYLPVSLSLSRPPRPLVVSFIVEASLSSLVIVVVVLAIVSPSSRSSSSFSPSVLVSSSSSHSPPPSPRLSLSAAVTQLYRYSPLSLVPSSPPVRISRRYLPLSRSSRNPLALSALLPRNSTTATGHRPPLTHPHLADFPPYPGVSTYILEPTPDRFFVEF